MLVSGNPEKIQERERQFITEYAQQYHDAFLREYAYEIRKCGFRTTEQAVSVQLRKLKWTLKKETRLSGIPLGALAATVVALHRGVDAIAAGTQGGVPLGEETAICDDWIRRMARASRDNL